MKGMGRELFEGASRRDFLTAAAGAAAAASAPGFAFAAAPTPRRVKVEYLFDAPGDDPQPNGLQATAAGLWIYDQKQAPSKAFLVGYEAVNDGYGSKSSRVIRAIDTQAVAGGGITFDGEHIWISSSYDCTILRVDQNTGRTLAKFDCPGIGPVNWPNPRTSPIRPVSRGMVPKPESPEQAEARRVASGMGLPRSQATAANPQARVNTGSHGLEWRDGMLWVVVPPSQTCYQLNPRTFAIQKQWKTPGDRPHGIAWEGRYLWVTDTNANMFHKCDPDTGAVSDSIQLADTDPLPHGMTIYQNHIWYCDDGGQICRFPLPA
jgi:hypothetical protein